MTVPVRGGEPGQAMEALTSQQYRLLVQGIAAIVWTASGSGEVVTDLPDWSAFTGQTSEQIKGWGWLLAIHPDDRAATAAVWSEAVATKSIFRWVNRVRRRDGEYRHMLVRGTPVIDADGSILQWVGAHIDISDSKQEEELRHPPGQLLEQLQEMDQLYRSAPVGLELLDRELRILRINERLAAANGRPVDELLGRTLWEILPEIAPQIGATVDRVFASGEPVFNLAIRGVVPADPENERDWLESYYPVKSSDGATRYVGGVIQDITELKKRKMACARRKKTQKPPAAPRVNSWPT
jgi:PAS domain S-box-containing protein